MTVALQRVFLAVILAAGAPLCAADGARETFLTAYRALARDDTATWRALAPGLRDYPLYPYLEYRHLLRHLDTAEPAAVSGFLAAYPDTPLAPRLRRHWLRHLADAERWETYLAFLDDEPGATDLRCHALHARLATGRATPAALLDDIQSLWLVGRSQPEACDPLFEHLYASARMGPDLLWRRIARVMAAGHPALARYLGRRLPASEQAPLDLWLRAHRHPAAVLAQARPAPDTPHSGAIFAHAVSRLARHDADAAWHHWERGRDAYALDAATVARVSEDLAVRAARQRSPDALARLAAVPASRASVAVTAWTLRVAARQGRWAAVRAAAGELAREDGDPAWRYWQARALEQLGDHAGARALYRAVARERSYYGFLAADHLGQPYAMTDRPTPEDPTRLATLAARPGLVRARELFALGLTLEARREWYAAMQALTPADQAQAALLARRWGWHDRAIATAYQAGSHDDLALRFPLAYRDAILEHTERMGLDPAWVMGLIRQESAFREDARSPAGALGLMQVMPATGLRTARLLDLPLRRPEQLLSAHHNLPVGTGYLKRMLERFDDHTVLATAAYNAGPNRVRHWLPERGCLAADVWVESIPFTETRRYVRGVLAFAAVFDWRLERTSVKVSGRMPPVPAVLEARP